MWNDRRCQLLEQQLQALPKGSIIKKTAILLSPW